LNYERGKGALTAQPPAGFEICAVRYASIPDLRLFAVVQSAVLVGAGMGTRLLNAFIDVTWFAIVAGMLPHVWSGT
jgi:hypothetical protein